MSEHVRRVSEWCYHGVWSILTRWLLVPNEPPTLPTVAGETAVSFRPSQGFLNYMRLFFWIACIAIDLVLLVLWIVVFFAVPWLGLAIAPIMLIVMILPDVVAYIALHLRYDTTWYVLTDRSMRIRRGIWTIHETTITFENIQNIRLQQGPLQRYLGFANLIVETAGGGSAGPHGQGGGSHVGLLEGLGDADQVRDLIMNRLEKCRSAGLGDEVTRDQVTSQTSFQTRHVALLREIATLTKKLATS